MSGILDPSGSGQSLRFQETLKPGDRRGRLRRPRDDTIFNFMRILDALRNLKKRFSRYEPLVTVVVFKDRLLKNVTLFKAAAPHLKIAPVLKSNAYGHGLIPVAKIFDKQNVPFLVVDSPYEATQLRQAGIQSKILIIGYTTAHNIKHFKSRNVSFTITSLDQLRAVAKTVRRLTCLHLKIDTGMHRQGVGEGDVPAAIEIFKNNKLIKLEGVCSHLADAIDHEDFTKKQIERWDAGVALIQKELGEVVYKHLSATSGFLFAQNIDANVARVGIGLYGFVPENLQQKIPVTPTLEMRACITSLRKLAAGECVGYDCTYTLDSPQTIATLPVGYFEGMDRRLSNIGTVLVDGAVCPIVGRVSMNIASVDVSNVKNPHLNQLVMVISANASDTNSVENIARDCKTIPYEILVHIPPQLRRTVV